MGYNTKKWDKEAAYNEATLKQLEEQRDSWIRVLEGHDCPYAREELAYVRLKIAERIGKKSV